MTINYRLPVYTSNRPRGSCGESSIDPVRRDYACVFRGISSRQHQPRHYKCSLTVYKQVDYILLNYYSVIEK